ncbi:hypothetical protein V493_01765 [Pseudogymnoascus sp. VKM F-4281 (FW-2241)]|nr:hypothetical protein V493_01765 [Pseudogymnoascus sp. VKM F-4281 (FW-2241)]
MFFSLPTIALAASLLSSSGVLAVPHKGHRHLHAPKRDAILVERDVVVVETVTNWVTVWWDGTSFITPSATSANAINTQAAAAAAEAPAPIANAAPNVTAAPASTEAAAKAAEEAAAKAKEEAAAKASAEAAAKAKEEAASNAANAATNAGKNPSPNGIIDDVADIVSSAVAPIVPSPTPIVVPPPVTNTGTKRGLAYNNADLASSFTGGDSQVSWAYNWGSTTPSIPEFFEYVPMLWGVEPVHSHNWQVAATDAIAKGSKHLLAFNEPDLTAQANIDPGTAAAGYKTFMQPFAGKAKLGSPAVTNGPAPMGIAYFQSFMAACGGCTVDFIPMHWYDAASNVEGFKKHVRDFRDVSGGRKLWITEFGAHGSPEEQEEFLRQVIPWLEAEDSVERYAYFYADGVLTQNNAVTALGNVFKSFIS